jgi:hypothetical protein
VDFMRWSRTSASMSDGCPVAPRKLIQYAGRARKFTLMKEDVCQML